MADTPVVLLNGARQTGKSTLMQALVAGKISQTQKVGVHYLTLDDPEVYAAARSNPHGFIGGHHGVMLIDEVQRVPDLFLAIKQAVDLDRTPGRFLMTGSANVMMLPRLSESLAGRMEILTLRPMAQCELTQSSASGELALSSTNLIDAWLAPSSTHHLVGQVNDDYPAMDRSNFLERLLIGGYPEVIARASEKRRAVWFANYLNTVLLRDIRDIAQIEGLHDLPRLLQAIAQRASGSLNLADSSRTLGLPQTTLRRYLTLLETVYLIESIPAWGHRETQRAQKMPKYYLNDSGLYAHVMGITPALGAAEGPSALIPLHGPLVETFVQSELRKHLSWAECSAQLMHYRTSSGVEVDFIIEDRAGRVVAIEVKSSLIVQESDLKGLRHLRALLGDRFVRGVVLHPGDKALQWDANIASIPMSCFWAPATDP